jgi:hypothetical protein
LRTGHTFNETLARIANRTTDVSGDVAEVSPAATRTSTPNAWPLQNASFA